MLNKDDIIKFYELLARLDLHSSNIGVVGDSYRFDRIIKTLQKDYKKHKNAKILINPERTKVTIIDKDIEITYIHIRGLNDMAGRYFRKYI